MEHSVLMKGRYASAMDAPEKMLLTALFLSLLLHLSVYGLWKIGETMGWWRQMGLPKWMQLVKKSNVPPLKKKQALLQPRPPTPLVFVEVDPTRAAEAPKDPKFYSSANSLASNPSRKADSDMPQIDGHQTVVVKTTDAASPKAQPLQPSPPKPQEKELSEPAPRPKPAYIPGDLAMVQRQDKIFDTNSHPQTQTQTSAAAVANDQPPPRPRSLAEAHQRQGMLAEPMRHEGGVSHIEMGPSAMDAIGTAWGDYDRTFIDAVQNRWYELLDRHPATMAGQVRLEFKLHSDGRITDLKMTKNTVNELLEAFCERAIEDPAPFQPWPSRMRQELTDPREVVFTFYYLNY